MLRQEATPPVPVSPTVDFGRFFSFDSYLRLAEHNLVRTSDMTHAWMTANDRLREELFAPALQEFFLALRDEGRLSPIAGGEGHRIDFLTQWNRMVETGLDDLEGDYKRWAWRDIVGRFAHGFVSTATYPASEAHAEGQDVSAMHRPAYEAMVARVNGGRIAWWEHTSEEYCFNTDERFRIDVEGWKIRLGKMDLSQRGKFVEIQPVDAPRVVELEVEFRTGELLVADWFHIDEFTKPTRAAADLTRGRPSIGSAAGCVEATRDYLDRFGFVSVAVGNTSPSILAIDGTMTFGWLDGDREEGIPEGVQPLGQTCTDRWWVTVIERARLVEIVAQTVGPEEAERKVAAYLAEDRYGLTKLTVEPGRYHLYFHGESEDFKDTFHSPELSIPEGVEPMFVLSPRQLPLEPRCEMAANTAPGFR